MAELFPVPEIAAGTTEIVVSDWLVAPGEAFKAGDAIAIIETEKAVVEVEAEADATLLRALVEGGKTAEVGAPMALIGSEEEVGADLDALLVDLGVSGPTVAREEPAVPPATPAAPTAEPSTGGEGRLFISPIARKLLKDAGVSPQGIEGSGPNGRIRRRDVEPIIAAAASGSSAVPARQEAAPPAAPALPAASARVDAAAAVGAGWTEVPHSRLRRAVARRLTESKQQVPHFYVRRTAVLDELLKLRARLNEASPTRISVNDFLIRAMAVAHSQVPDANVIWTDEAMRQFDSVDISVAIASDRGLVTPVLRGVEKSSLSAISAQVKDFVTRANEGTLQQSDLEGGSISISNLGMYGVDDFTAIINPPQSAILAVGAGRPTPIAVGNKVKVRTAVELVLSVDHRAIDGALAARWMTALVDAIHEPLRLLV
jgi:pyruvate dehydrogenase E2 component (dihydrolipoamide acetyltransferase)